MEKGPVQKINDGDYKFPWRDGSTGFRAVLANRSDTPLGDGIPFCVGSFLGELIQEITEGMGQDAFRASVHVPVAARYGGDKKLREHMLHMEFECDVACHAERADEADTDWLRSTAYADGTVRLLKLVGPLQWRSVRWSGMTLCFSPIDRPVRCGP